MMKSIISTILIKLKQMNMLTGTDTHLRIFYLKQKLLKIGLICFILPGGTFIIWDRVFGKL